MRQMLSGVTVALGKFIEAEKLQGKYNNIYIHTYYLNLISCEIQSKPNQNGNTQIPSRRVPGPCVSRDGTCVSKNESS